MDVYPDVSTPPITGPALKVKDHLLVWNESSNDDIQIRVIFDAGVNELAKNEITLKNCGTVGITFSWTVSMIQLTLFFKLSSILLKSILWELH